MGFGSFCFIAILFLGPEAGILYYTLGDMLCSVSFPLRSGVGPENLHFLTIFQGMLMLLISVPQFESHCPRVCSLSIWLWLACLPMFQPEGRGKEKEREVECSYLF